MSEVWIDPADEEAEGLEAAIKYVDSTSLVTGVLTGEFIDREFAIASNGVIVKMIAGATLDGDKIRFNYLQVEKIYELEITTVGVFSVLYGDLMINVRFVSGVGDVATAGRVLRRDGGVITYQLLTPDNFADGWSLSFERPGGPGEPFSSLGTGSADDDPSSELGIGVLPSGIGTTLTGLESGALLEGLGTAVAAGNDSNPGTYAEPMARCFQAMFAAQLERANASLSEVEDGCTIKLFPGDYVLGPKAVFPTLNSGSTGYYAVVTSVEEEHAARIVGSIGAEGGIPPGLGASRLRLNRVILHNSSATGVCDSPSNTGTLWIDGCIINGVFSNIAGPIAGNWAAGFTTNTLVTKRGGGIGGVLCRDCAIVDVGGDLLSGCLGALNLEWDHCNTTANHALHPDVAQFEPGSWDNILWFHVFGRRINHAQPVPHFNGTSFENVAFVNVIQIIEDGQFDRSGGLGRGDSSNFLMWNCTSYSVFAIGHPDGHTAENISIRSCFFQGVVSLGGAPVYTAWFRNNYYFEVGGTPPANIYLAPGVNARHEANRNLDDDLFVTTDADSSDFYKPKVVSIPWPPPTPLPPANPLIGAVPSAEIVVGTDVLNFPYYSEIGARVSLEP